MKKTLLLLLPILLLSACITINKEVKPDASIQKTPMPYKDVRMKPSSESEIFVDPSDGLTYKWVKVRVMTFAEVVPYHTSPYRVLPVATTPATAIRFEPTTGIFKDERDGQIYKTVTLGKQTWMAQNLNYKTPTQSFYYNDDPKNGPVYGMLYNWNVLLQACPKGWHIPTNAEWEELEYNAGMTKEDTAKEKYRGNIAPNFMDGGATKMNIVFGGTGSPGDYKGEGQEAHYWTSTRVNNPITSRIFRIGDNRICKNHNGEAYYYSVRYVKDADVTKKK
jgi:uncharacterized protein (TIGR02145 family)